jgi:hypothetical protein
VLGIKACLVVSEIFLGWNGSSSLLTHEGEPEVVMLDFDVDIKRERYFSLFLQRQLLCMYRLPSQRTGETPKFPFWLKHI